jgi:sterol 3beta-glucosyltransferase
MRITIFTAGSHGDVLPCILLGRGLQQEGFDVVLAAPQNFEDLTQRNGVRIHPLRGDVQQIMASETGRKLMETGGANPILSMLAVRKMIGPLAIQMAEDALDACRESDALICLAVFAPFGKSIAQIQRIPLINVEPTPLLPTRAFPAAGWSIQQNLGGLHNRLSAAVMLQMIWQWYGPSVNEFRKRFGLRPLRGSDFQHILHSTPLLSAYSRTVIPHPSDWSDDVRITGYWFADTPSDWHPFKELEDFLAKGSPPVYIGFGSMGGRTPEQLAKLVLEALVKSGQRGVLLTGWGGLRAEFVPDNVFVVDAAPHSWLFPRMAAVVHHGGAGTTAEGLRAGVPTVVVPFAFDQPFWGARMKEFGFGPEPIPIKKLTADRLAKAIRIAVTDPGMRQRASSCGEAIRAEDGIGNAIKIIKQHLGEPGMRDRKENP